MKKYLIIPFLMSVYCLAMEVDKDIVAYDDQYVVLLTSDGEPIKVPMKCAKNFSLLAHIFEDYDSVNGMEIPLDKIDSSSIRALEELFCERKDKESSRTKQKIHRLENAALVANYLGLDGSDIDEPISRIMQSLIKKDSLSNFARGSLDVTNFEPLWFPHLQIRFQQLLQGLLPINPKVSKEKRSFSLREGVNAKPHAFSAYSGKLERTLTREEPDYRLKGRLKIKLRSYKGSFGRTVGYIEDVEDYIIERLTLSRNEKYLATWGRYYLFVKKLYIWEVSKKAGHRSDIIFKDKAMKNLSCMAWHPTRDVLAYASSKSGILSIFDGKRSIPIDLESNSIHEFKWSPCGNYIVVKHELESDVKLSVYDGQTYEMLGNISENGDKTSSFEWSPDSNQIALTTGCDIDIINWKTSESYRLKHYKANRKCTVKRINWIANGRHVIIFLSDKSNYVWDLENKVALGSIKIPKLLHWKSSNLSWNHEENILISKWVTRNQRIFMGELREGTGTLYSCSILRWHFDHLNQQKEELWDTLTLQSLKQWLFCYYALAYPAHTLALLERKDSPLRALYNSSPEEIQNTLAEYNSSLTGSVKKGMHYCKNKLI